MKKDIVKNPYKKLLIPYNLNVKAMANSTVFKYKINKRSGETIIDKDYSGKIEILFKDNPEKNILLNLVMAYMEECIQKNPRKALNDIPSAMLELPEIKESFDKNLGKVYTKEFAKLFGIKLVDKTAEHEVDNVRREIFEEFKKDKKYVPNDKFDEYVVARMKNVSSEISLQEIYSSVAGTQKYFDLMTMQVSDECTMNSRLYHLYRNRDQESQKAKETLAQV